MSDIIETLRRLQCSDAACGDLRIAMAAKLAIFEIERLRADLKVMTEEHRLACDDRDLVKRERDESDAEKITLKAALDEARREVCAHEADTAEDQREHAAQRGWDCFQPSEERTTISYKETP